MTDWDGPEAEWERQRERLRNVTSLQLAIMLEEQRLSFAYGQTKFRNPHWTRDDMQLVCDEMDLVVRGNN